MRREDVVPGLVLRVPAFEPVLRQHLDVYDGELLEYLLFADLSRFVISAYQTDDESIVRTTLEFLEDVLARGNEEAQNLVINAFVYNIAPGDVSGASAFERWPPRLRAWHCALWSTPYHGPYVGEFPVDEHEHDQG